MHLITYLNRSTFFIGIIIITNFCITITNGLPAENDSNASISSSTVKSSTVSISDTTDNSSSTTSAENMIMSSTNNYINRADTKKEQTPSRSKILDNIFNVNF